MTTAPVAPPRGRSTPTARRESPVSPTSLNLVVTLLFGVQLVRSLVSSGAMYLYDASELPALVAGSLVAAPVVGAAVLANRVARIRVNALAASCLIVVAARVALQISTSPTADYVLGAAGVMGWIWYVACSASLMARESDGRRFAVALLVAIALDTTLKGAFDTMDLAWAQSGAAYAIVAILSALQLLSLGPVRSITVARLDAQPRSTSVLYALGPILVVQLMEVQNIGLQVVQGGASQEGQVLAISTANAFAVLAVMRAPSIAVRPISTALAGTALALLLWTRPAGGLLTVRDLVAVLLAAHLILTLGISLQPDGAHAARSDRTPAVFAVAAGLLTFLGLVLAYHASYEIALPIDRRLVAPAAALVATATVMWMQPANRLVRRAGSTRPAEQMLASTVVALVVLLPFGRLAVQTEPLPDANPHLPMRVMTYNLHHGFDAHGGPSIERIAQIVEDDQPDVVALQEVSRSWLVAGSFDMLVWLSRRLDMPYVWGPAVDGTWGNAVLSRYPIRDARTFPMPNNDELRLDRSFTRVDIDAGDGQTVRIFATHLHAVRGDTQIRLEQLESMIAAGASGRDGNVLVLGDLNFRQWEPEYDLLRSVGLVDAYKDAPARSESEDRGATSRANVRIDYVWTAESLETSDFAIGSEFASDHLPVSVTVR